MRATPYAKMDDGKMDFVVCKSASRGMQLMT